MKEGISEEDLKNIVYSNHWANESWHEVLRLIAGMIEPEFVAEIVEHLMNMETGETNEFLNLFLAAECLEEVRNRSMVGDTVSTLTGKLRKLVKWDLLYTYQPWELEETTKVHRVRSYPCGFVNSSFVAGLFQRFSLAQSNGTERRLLGCTSGDCCRACPGLERGSGSEVILGEFETNKTMNFQNLIKTQSSTSESYITS